MPQMCNTYRGRALARFWGMASTLTVKSGWRHTFSQRHLSLYRLALFFASFLVVQELREIANQRFSSHDGWRWGKYD
jgi:hypothetical protein